MAEAKVSTYTYGIILAAIIMIGGITMITMMASDIPGITEDENFQQFNDSFYNINEITSNLEATEQTLDNPVNETTAYVESERFLDSLVQTSWNALKILNGALDFMHDSYTNLSEMWGLPSFIPILVILLISMMIVFTVFAAIFGWRI